MICPACKGEGTSRVLESRERKDYVYRRRMCEKCGYEYKTREVFWGTVKTTSGPALLSISEMNRSWEAVWLEVLGVCTTLSPTTVKKVTERTVEFTNGMIQVIPLLNRQWRVWSKRPNDKIRRETPWKRMEEET